MRIHRTLLLFFFFAVSCKPAYIVGHRPAPVAPFVLLKDSTRIAAKEVRQKGRFGRIQIVADDNSFAGNEVATYSDGKQTYRSDWSGSFLPLIATGKINVYSDATLFEKHLVLQNKSNGSLEDFSYSALRRNIMPGEPGYDILRRYKRNQIILTPIAAVALACFVSGFLVYMDGVNTPGSHATTGEGMMLGGLGVYLYSSISLSGNKRRLKRALATHNGVYP